MAVTPAQGEGVHRLVDMHPKGVIARLTSPRGRAADGWPGPFDKLRTGP
jgi:hypothetical protein